MSPQSTRGNAEKDRQQVDREMANWTRWVAFFTGCLFFASLVSDLFIYLQYYAATNAQADNREQLRAFITNSTTQIAAPDNIDDPDQVVSVTPTFQNFGGTRTSHFSAHANLKFFDGGIPSSLDLSKPYLEFKAGESTIGPNSLYAGFAVGMPAPDVRQAKDGKGKILYWGQAEYSDIFNPDVVHHVRYCQLLNPVDFADPKHDASSKKIAFQVIPYKDSCNRND
jgi:hypothetical protein